MGWDADEAREQEEGGVPYPYERFNLTIEMGNAAMLDPYDVSGALGRVAEMMRTGGWEGSIYDDNGNTVGSYSFVKRDV